MVKSCLIASVVASAVASKPNIVGLAGFVKDLSPNQCSAFCDCSCRQTGARPRSDGYDWFVGYHCSDGSSCCCLSDDPNDDDAGFLVDKCCADGPGPGDEYAQCGGKEFKGLTTCNSGLECIKQNDYDSYCMKRPTIVDLATSVPSLSTLVTAIVAGDLVTGTPLSEGGPFTVFAPTNEAFNALGTNRSYPNDDGSLTVESMLKPQNKEQLVIVLKNHVAEGTYEPWFGNSSGSWAITTIGGQHIGGVDGRHVGPQTWVGGPPFWNPEAGMEAFSMLTTMEAFDGVVHIIDGLLLPAKRPSATVVV